MQDFPEYTGSVPDLASALSLAGEAVLEDAGDSPVALYSDALRRAIGGEASKAAEALTARLASASVSAMSRVEALVDSPDENVAGKNARFVIEHLIGKPKTHSVSVTYKANVDYLAE